MTAHFLLAGSCSIWNRKARVLVERAIREEGVVIQLD
jgi:hypothetical protein